jgi:hypothetical protein
VLFLVFNEGYLATGPGTDPVRHDLTAEAIRLTRLIRTLLPDDGEAAGLLALMLLTEARRTARVSAGGELATGWCASASPPPPGLPGHRPQPGHRPRRDRLPDTPPRPAGVTHEQIRRAATARSGCPQDR